MTGDTSSNVFIVQGCFGYMESFKYLYEYYFAIFVKNCTGILMKIALSLWIVFGRIIIFYQSMSMGVGESLRLLVSSFLSAVFLLYK